jgi:putative membrane protein
MTISSSITRFTTMTLAVVAFTACGKGDNAADTTKTDSATMSNPAMSDTTKASGTLNDAQIAHVAVTANSIDSAAGELAKKNGGSKAVKDFGQTMVTDHGNTNKQAVALAQKLGVTPEDNDVSKSLKSGGDANMSNLQGKTGAAFDSAYIANEVTYHQAVLDALDKTLIPGAQNAELKALLTNVRPVIAEQLEHPKQIHSNLGNT